YEGGGGHFFSRISADYAVSRAIFLNFFFDAGSSKSTQKQPESNAKATQKQRQSNAKSRVNEPKSTRTRPIKKFQKQPESNPKASSKQAESNRETSKGKAAAKHPPPGARGAKGQKSFSENKRNNYNSILLPINQETLSLFKATIHG
ncbi:Hypothetical protein, putative, partial [Bodo saltans]